MNHYQYQRSFLLSKLRALRRSWIDAPTLDLIVDCRRELAELRANRRNHVVWQPDSTGPAWAKGRAWEPATGRWYWVEACPQLFSGYLDTGNMRAAWAE